MIYDSLFTFFIYHLPIVNAIILAAIIMHFCTLSGWKLGQVGGKHLPGYRYPAAGCNVEHCQLVVPKFEFCTHHKNPRLALTKKNYMNATLILH